MERLEQRKHGGDLEELKRKVRWLMFSSLEQVALKPLDPSVSPHLRMSEVQQQEQFLHDVWPLSKENRTICEYFL